MSFGFPLAAVNSIVLTVQLAGGSAATGVLDPASASASVRLQRDGEVERNQGSGFVDWHDWHKDKSLTVGDAYECRATLQSGVSPSAGTLDTWQDLTGNVSWTNNQTGEGTRTSTLLIEVRHKVKILDYASASYSVTAVVSPPE